jgi:thiol:disulfide interchange protein DsbD
MNQKLFLLILTFGLAGYAYQLDGAPNGQKAAVDWFASVKAAVPGKPFEVAIRIRMDEGWHIYWQNPGESGLPPKVNWNLPNGFTADELRFPVPKRYVAAGNIVSNVLEDEATLLATVTPSPSISGEKVRLAAEVIYYICKDVCIRETAKLELELPIQRDGEPEVTNPDVFSMARKSLPAPSSKHLTIKPSIHGTDFAPRKSFELLLTVDIAPGFHIQSHKPLQSTLIKADLFLERVPGVTFKDAQFPEGQLRQMKVLGQVSEYSGRIQIRVPAQVDDEPLKSRPKFGGVFTFQACDDKGNCLPPDALSFSLAVDDKVGMLPVGGGGDSSPVAATTTTAEDPGGLEGYFSRMGLLGQLLACFLYGVFINATPCVLPLLSVKVLGFVQQAHESRRRTALLGLSFGAGVILFFVLLGLLASAGANVLQFPVAVIALGAVVLAMALAMLGVYTLQMPTAAASLEARIVHEGLASSFGKGALAPVLGFACTGPLLAGAFGWATQQPPTTAVLAFLAAGLGMAAPYMLLGANPRWLGFLPRPGKWMITFERIMGFLLLAMVVWLINPLVTLIGAGGLQWTLVFFVAVGMACWIWGRIDFSMSSGKRIQLRTAAVGLVALTAFLVYGWVYPLAAAVDRQRELLMAEAGLAAPAEDTIAWRRWSPEDVRKEVESGSIVFVDFTASYCTVCKVNKKLAINTPEFKSKMDELNAVAFQGDFSFPDLSIADELKKHNRPGVPLNLIYPAGKPDEPIVLPPNLSKQLLTDKLAEASRATGSTN